MIGVLLVSVLGINFLLMVVLVDSFVLLNGFESELVNLIAFFAVFFLRDIVSFDIGIEIAGFF